MIDIAPLRSLASPSWRRGGQPRGPGEGEQRAAWPRLQPQEVIPPLVLIVAGLAVYHNSFAGPFIFDDICSIPNNPHIRGLWPPWQALSPPAHCTIEGRPLANFSLAVNYALG